MVSIKTRAAYLTRPHHTEGPIAVLDCYWARLAPQVSIIIIGWFFLCALHWNNDGLWFFDATQHAAHGLFWKDFLGNITSDPWDYVMSYYARYPIIRPTRYPPAFYFPMAIAYRIFGASPFIAKGCVLSTTLMAALYTMAWCRKWVAKEVGWAGILIMFLPIVVTWSHAVMLNVPVLALSIAGLYHYRIWLSSPHESPAWRHLYLGALFAVLSILTHVVNCVIALVFVVWLFTERKHRMLLRIRTLLVIFFSALALLPWYLIVMKYEQGRVSAVSGSSSWITDLAQWHWFYYSTRAPSLFGYHVLVLAGIGTIIGLRSSYWRQETIRLLILMLTCYLFYTYLPWPDVRYIIVFSLPLVLLSSFAIVKAIQWLITIPGRRPPWPSIVTTAATLFIIGGQAWMASRVHVPSVHGYQELVGFLETVASNEALFYDGIRTDTFAYYVQAGDPDYKRRAVCGNRLLYARGGGNSPNEDYVSSPNDVIHLLEHKGACQWIAVDDIPLAAQGINAHVYLREAVKGPEFEFIKSFPIVRKHWREGFNLTKVNVYRFLKPITPVKNVDIPYVSKGKIIHHCTKPIERN